MRVGYWKTVGRREVTAVSQIFLELGRGMDCGPSIELAHSYRTADVSARAQPGTVRRISSKIKQGDGYRHARAWTVRLLLSSPLS
jgi:hypothetical protein